MLLHVVLVADPYLNTDAGTLAPFEHGEVFVLDDGGEVSNTFYMYCCVPNFVTRLLLYVTFYLSDRYPRNHCLSDLFTVTEMIKKLCLMNVVICR